MLFELLHEGIGEGVIVTPQRSLDERPMFRRETAEQGVAPRDQKPALAKLEKLRVFGEETPLVNGLCRESHLGWLHIIVARWRIC